MTIRIGIVGPEDSVKRISTVAKDFSNVEIVPLIYRDVYQVDALIRKQTRPIDQWLFSGVLNYQYAIVKKFVSEENATYPPLHGSSLFATILEAQLANKKVYRKISIDTFSNEEIEKTLSFYNLQDIQFFNYPFSDYTYIHQLADFHEKLYLDGQTEVALTSTNYAYVQLKERNIPVYRIKPSYLSIKLSLTWLIERAQTHRLQKSQIAIIGCTVDFSEDKSESMFYTYKTLQEELNMKKELIKLAEKVNESFISADKGFYLIYTNRGEIDQEIEKYLVHLSKNMYHLYQKPVHFAIGYGETAAQAEQHVHVGFQQKKELFSLLIVNEKREVKVVRLEDFDQIKSYQFSTISTDSEWQRKI